MQSHPDQDALLEEQLEAFARYLGPQQSLRQPQQPTHLERIIKNSWNLILGVVVAELFFPISPFYTLFLFPLLSPFTFLCLVRGYFIYYFDRYLTTEESGPWLAAAESAIVFVATLVVFRLFHAVWFCLCALFRLVVSTEVLWTSCALVVGLISFKYFPYSALFRFQQRVYGMSAFCVFTAVDLLSNGLYHAKICFSVCQEGLSSLAITRWLTTCVEAALSWILWQPAHEPLPTFNYESDCSLSHAREIRLLRLHRRLPFGKLRAEIFSANLDYAPAYECISYCWGPNPESTQPIMLNSRHFLVPPNVLDILYGRSSIYRERIIWIDFICINQTNDKEKTHQVRMMREIYSSATNVMVCLGEGADSRGALNLLNLLVLLKTSMPNWLQRSVLEQQWVQRRTNKATAANWEALTTMLRHTWFDRVWIVQEVVVARSVIILYGGHEITWDVLNTALDLLYDEDLRGFRGMMSSSGDNTKPRGHPRGAIHARLIDGYRVVYHTRGCMHIHEVLTMYLAFNASVPVDKVIALIGFTDEVQELNYLIDYTKSSSEILTSLAHFLLKKGSLLEVMHLAGIGWDESNPEDLPSWVVEWTKSREPVPLAQPFSAVPYRAALSKAPQIAMRTLECISVRGLIIDRVATCIKTAMPTGSLDGLFDSDLGTAAFDRCVECLEEIDTLARSQLRHPYYTGQPAQEVIWRTLCGDRTSTSRPVPQHLAIHFSKSRRVIQALHSTFVHNGNSFDLGTHCPSSISPALDNVLQDTDGAIAFASAVNDSPMLLGGNSFVRTVCFTDHGYIALVPRYTRPGDVVCLVFGAEVPFVLRPVGEGAETRYQLVGECYVHGIMDGEGLELGRGEMEFEIF